MKPSDLDAGILQLQHAIERIGEPQSSWEIAALKAYHALLNHCHSNMALSNIARQVPPGSYVKLANLSLPPEPNKH